MWKLVREPHRVFARNPLAAVIFALDFEPILKIEDGNGIPDFQDSIRSRFPKYSEGMLIDVVITPDRAETRQAKAHEFSASESLKVVLSSRSVSRDARTHKSREELVDDVSLVLRALEDTYKPILVQRVGLRYVNIFDAVEISRALGRPVNWSTLLAPRYMQIPPDVVNMEDTRFVHDVTSSMQRGTMTLRYGLTLRPEKGRPCIHFDTDRYVVDAVPCEDVAGLVSGFSEDIYDLFMTAVGPDLLDWMDGKGIN